jgi:hypothetical protein
VKRPDVTALRALLAHPEVFRAPWKASTFELLAEDVNPKALSGVEVDEEGDFTEDAVDVARVEAPEEYPDGQVIADVYGLEGFARANGALIVALRNEADALLDAAEERDALAEENVRALARVQEMEKALREIHRLATRFQGGPISTRQIRDLAAVAIGGEL